MHAAHLSQHRVLEFLRHQSRVLLIFELFLKAQQQ